MCVDKRAQFTWGIDSQELDGIEKAVKRASKITRQLLVFARREQTAPIYFSLASLCKECEAMLKRFLNPNIVFSLISMPEKAEIFADPVKIEMAIINLVVNARDALPNGGKIKLSTGHIKLEEASDAVNSVVEPGHWSFVEVEDDGTGIAPEIQEKVFEPFFTTKEADKGTGLGLASVIMITKAYAGHLILESASGKGTRIRLLFPDAKNQAKASAENATINNEYNNFSFKLGKDKTLLLVVRDDAIRTIIEVLLAKAGFSVHSTKEAGEALLMAEQFNFDIIIADYIMPLISAENFAARTRLLFADIPILFLGDGNTEDILFDKAKQIQAGSIIQFDKIISRSIYLSKPFMEDELFSALTMLFAQRHKNRSV